ncbi:MAG: ATP-binding protein [Lachnospiraceae bacterium]|nr:ATP-binding protein [Lachnospiraceae bacterium]
MGIYLNPNNKDFGMALNSEIYVDKSMLIKLTNKVICTEQRFVSVSRPRRFGKSMAANMLTAYYSRGCDSREMFFGLKINNDKDKESFEKYLNKYNVIHINIVDFLSEAKDIDEMISFIQEDISDELFDEFSGITFPRRKTLVKILETVFSKTGVPFVFIIDEWDCIFRERKEDFDSQKIYLDFLRNLLKDKSYVALAYMTGILPIKKYGKHSAINMFTEISMTNAGDYAEFTGFTEKEVEALCKQYHMSFDEARRWYDGYNLRGISIYNPRSVVMSMTSHTFDNYWTSTETYEALKIYIQTDDMKETVNKLIAGEEVAIDTTTFLNDMVTFNSMDDVLTLLIHLGYLTYNFDTKKVSIPNYEITEQFVSTVRIMGWSEMSDSIMRSNELLKATIACDEEQVAEFIEQAHTENVSILKYNDENSLSYVISLAYYSSRKTYTLHREVPAGKGFADIVFVPRNGVTTPAMIIELKYNQSAETAIEQAKNRNYADFFKDYKGDILLVGINYSKDDPDKKHTCRIEKIKK